MRVWFACGRGRSLALGDGIQTLFFVAVLLSPKSFTFPRSIAMPRLSIRTPAVGLAVVAGALALAACSDSPVSPTSSLRSSAASFSVSGTNPLTIVSDASTQYCAGAQLNGGNNAVGDWSIPATFGPVAGCGAGTLNLDAALQVYNPGWSQPFAGSSWIGIETKGGPSSDYRPNPGRYVFQETFSVPSLNQVKLGACETSRPVEKGFTQRSSWRARSHQKAS